jgi:transmembrane sensor
MIRAAATPEWLAGMTAGEAAAAWAVRLGEIPAAAGDEEAFRSWLTSDPAHVDAWAAAMHAWCCLDNLASAQDDALAGLRSDAIDAGPEHTARWGRFAAIAATVLAIAGSAAFLMQAPSPNGDGAKPDLLAVRGPADLEAGKGQAAYYRLPDRSRVSLEPESAIDLVFTADRRSVRLLRGEAVFLVSPNAQRPFSVEAADHQIVALGTRFAVELSEGNLRVRLLEGEVSVGVPGSGRQPVVMQEGQELLSRGGSAIVRSMEAPRAGAVSSASAVVIFDNDTLAEAAAELNKNSERRLVVRDPRVAGLRVSGRFLTGDVERFAHIVAEIHPVRVTRRDDGAVEILPTR